ncbi:hypothetical protein BC835DRAFT_455368 [Cytidiella melzeri]|nr:hypothetical protein BC835DRAFT_455368 [Cytidiella melzeri]
MNPMTLYWHRSCDFPLLQCRYSIIPSGYPANHYQCTFCDTAKKKTSACVVRLFENVVVSCRPILSHVGTCSRKVSSAEGVFFFPLVSTYAEREPISEESDQPKITSVRSLGIHYIPAVTFVKSTFVSRSLIYRELASSTLSITATNAQPFPRSFTGGKGDLPVVFFGQQLPFNTIIPRSTSINKTTPCVREPRWRGIRAFTDAQISGRNARRARHGFANGRCWVLYCKLLRVNALQMAFAPATNSRYKVTH